MKRDPPYDRTEPYHSHRSSGFVPPIWRTEAVCFGSMINAPSKE